jgi:cobyrinic acid a,c-diamide synthase
MSLIIAGERSGAGKTTVTLAILAFLAEQGLQVQSFKVGPDYIDPMFHSAITARPCRNLDPILTAETYVKSCFTHHTQDVPYSLIEGVMGLYDGVNVSTSLLSSNLNLSPAHYASTAHIARLLELPVLLVIDCSRLSASVAAIALGYRSLDPQINLAGVILNRVGSDRHLNLLQEALKPLNLPILGVLRRQEEITIPDRHLGLVPTPELPQLKTIFNKLAHLAATYFNWDLLFPLLKTIPTHRGFSHLIAFKQDHDPRYYPKRVKIAIAEDPAFNFYYGDNLEIWQNLGAELIPWSPIRDKSLPEGVTGLYFGGGFPEIFAQSLSENQEAKEAVKKAINLGMPTYAECGGLMYLCENLQDFNEQTWPMVGIIPTTTIMDSQLTLGYRQAKATNHSFLLNQGETVWGHEFHHSRLSSHSPYPLYNLKGLSPQSVVVKEGWKINNLHASYLHLHFGGCLTLAQQFITNCLAFSQNLR